MVLETVTVNKRLMNKPEPNSFGTYAPKSPNNGLFLWRFFPRELTLPIGFCAGVSRPNGRLARIPWFVFWKKNTVCND